MRALVTGGCGFVGSRVAQMLLGKGYEVTLFDDLSRTGAERNLQRLTKRYGQTLDFVRGDVREVEAVLRVSREKEIIFHCAAQVAVTLSVNDPRRDFEVNALGTFNVLEAARRSPFNPIVVFTSTNKVYGNLNVDVREEGMRYSLPDGQVGINEHHSLDFHSPYGCSKGAADQYVRDYSRIYGLRTVLFRMSCIYGPGQFGNEDQGWVAHLVMSWLLHRPLIVYGDGKQVRDILFISDLLRAFELAMGRIDYASGEVFNIGGGISNSISLLELIEHLTRRFGYRIPVKFAGWRPGDQRFYVSDISKAKSLFGWSPTIGVETGLARLINWAEENISVLA